MILGFMFMLLMFGSIVSLMGFFMPAGFEAFSILFWGVGLSIQSVGAFMVWSRAHKTGVWHFLDPGRPGTIKWFYVERDGSVKITDSMREVEGSLYSKEMDALIKDMKSYKLFDHSVRFVPAGIGHSVDLDMCLYAHMLKTKWGFNNLREARKGGFSIFGYPKEVKKTPTEKAYINREVLESE